MRCRHRTAFATAAALAGLFLAGVATASNMGFALNLSLPVEGSPSRHWVSLPWVYAPTTAKALCADLGGSTKVASVWRWDEASSSFVSHACTFTTDGFSLVKGVAYGVQNAPGQTVTALVVGSHDDAYTYLIAPTTGSNLTWISIPYHHDLRDQAGVSGTLDAEDLCRAIGPAVAAVVRWDAPAGVYRAYACGSELDTPFEIQLVFGYGLVNAAGQTITWQPPHF